MIRSAGSTYLVIQSDSDVKIDIIGLFLLEGSLLLLLFLNSTYFNASNVGLINSIRLPIPDKFFYIYDFHLTLLYCQYSLN